MNYASNYYYFRDSMEGLSIREILAHLNEVLKMLPGSIYLKDKEGVYLGCNEFQAKMAGFDDPELIIGKTDYDLPWKGNASEIRVTDLRIMTSGIPEENIEDAITADGTSLKMLSIKAPFYDDNGNIIGIVGTSLDVTSRIKAEQRERAALEEKRKVEETARRILMVLAGSIAHDLRSPLMYLDALNHDLKTALPVLLEYYKKAQMAGITLDRDLTHKEQSAIASIPISSSKIDDQITRMHTFINDNLKAIKRSTTNNLKEDDLVECQTHKVISNALESYPFKAGERELIVWDRSNYFNFMGNPLLVMRIIFNLLANSLHQIHLNNKGLIHISTEQSTDKNMIKFKDTAGGISQSSLQEIFEGFTTTKEHGTGIGLAFCKMTMESFGGNMICSSTEGDYIEFTLEFPKIIKS